MTRLVWDTRTSPCASHSETTRLEEKGDVVKKPQARFDAWAEAHRWFSLSDLPLQMARTLGGNPKKHYTAAEESLPLLPKEGTL
jgi:hypothetical protein